MSIGLIAALVADILAVTPVPQNADTNGWWMQRHFAKIEEAKKSPPKVVFVGDSITHFWEQWHYGYIQWDHYFKGEPYRALNLGFSADRTEHVLWRLDHGELDGYEAKAVVLMIGTNNLGHRDEAPIDTVIGIRRVVEKIREKQPTAKVILCGILPRGKGGRDSLSAKVARVNRAIAAFADERNVVFCDFGERLLTADGRLLRGIMPDLLHPAGEGYEIWANAVIPYVNWALTAGSDALPMASLLPTRVNPDITQDDCAWHQGVAQSRIDRCVGRKGWWFERMAAKRREIAELGNKIDLVFLGDSITQGWEGSGADELAALRKKHSVVDLGYSADGVHHLLWRLEMGELDGYTARGVMMMIGTNNQGNKAIVPVVAKMLDLIRAKQPQANVLLCGILPMGREPDHPDRKPRRETNLLLEKLAKEKGVEWIDFGSTMLDGKGFMPAGDVWSEHDWLHLKSGGYRAWRTAVEPVFDRWFATGKAKPEKVVEGTLFVPPSGPAEKQTLTPDPVELYAGPAVTPKGTWRLSPGMARIDGNLLTVEVDEKDLVASKGHAYPSGRLKLDLSDFRGGIEVSIRARAENVVGKTNPMTGFKFQLPYTDRLSGQPFWAEPRGCVGTFGWKTFTFKADLSTKDVPSAELTLGLQDATGKAVYDLSTLTVRPLRGAFPPVTNRDYRQVYSDRVKAWPQLRGAMLPPADKIREKDFADLRAWGATLVRYQMGTAPGENAADLAVYRKWVDRMADKLTRDLIPWARKHGLRICVDLHSKPGGRFGRSDSMMFYNSAAADCFVESWQKLARRAKGNGDVIYGYDLANEPMQTQAGVTDYFSLQKRAAEAIRAIDPETPIVVESNMMDSPEQFPYLPALELKDVIYQVHMYVPGGYTHQGLGSAGSPARPKYPDPERGWDREFLKKALRHVRDFERRHGARIFVGEFSAMCYAEGADRYIADCISIFREYGWDWTYHAFREWDGWSVEHMTKDGVKEPKNFIPSPDNPRKRALIRGMKGEQPNVLKLESEIDWSAMICGKKGAHARGGFSVGGNRFLIGGKENGNGIGTYAPSVLDLDLGGNALRFTASGAADDIATGEMVFNVYGDGRLLASSGPMRAGMKPHPFDIDLAGVRTIRLEVAEGADGNAGDVADWLGPQFAFKSGTYPMNDVRMASPQLGILTPPAGKVPRINTPARYGVRPGHELVYRIPVVGRDVRVSVEGLERLAGVSFDPATRILRGRVGEAGDRVLKIVAENADGRAEKRFTVCVGEKIALTPPMGFNSWNCHQMRVTQEKMKRAADAMVASGLADHGYQYVVIDDFWMRDGEKGWPDWHGDLKGVHGPMRDAKGRMAPNDNFPDMKGLADYVHAKGLKAGLYSSPGPLTCGSCSGSWRHERIDAETFAAWGFDFLKYDWCTYGDVSKGEKEPERGIRPYRLMGGFLRAQDRDILFSLCQYGMWDVGTWGASVGGQMWRTTGDVFDGWKSVSGAIALQKRLWRNAGPGGWNDPDMLVVGPMCWNGFKGSRLAPNEQYAHLSMWAMVAAPLMIGCDMERLDPLTLSLLTNDEVIAIDQDELGAAAACVVEGPDREIWARPLADGSVAVALYNKALRPQVIELPMEKLGLMCKWRVRDVWRQEDEGVFLGRYETEVYGHAVHLLRLSPLPCGHLREGMKDIREQK